MRKKLLALLLALALALTLALPTMAADDALSKPSFFEILQAYIGTILFYSPILLVMAPVLLVLSPLLLLLSPIIVPFGIAEIIIDFIRFYRSF